MVPIPSELLRLFASLGSTRGPFFWPGIELALGCRQGLGTRQNTPAELGFNFWRAVSLSLLASTRGHGEVRPVREVKVSGGLLGDQLLALAGITFFAVVARASIAAAALSVFIFPAEG